MENNFYIGTDIGGTTFTSAIFNNSKELILQSKKDLINNFDNQEALLSAISNQILSISKKFNIIGVGLACPGPLNAKSGKILKTPNLKILHNCNIKKEIEYRTKYPCRIENDANLFALGEYKNYNLKKDVFAGITLGTGLGFGIIINGKLFTGGNGMAGEYGISPINYKNWEYYNSIKWIENKIFSRFGKNFSPKHLFKLAQSNNNLSIEIWNEFGQNLGLCLSHLINMIDPNAISVGGGLSSALPFFQERMKKIIRVNSPSFAESNIHIYESKHKEDSAMLGASLLFKE